MLSSYLGSRILNGFLYNQNIQLIDPNITQTYLGLLLTLPQNSEQPYEDGSYLNKFITYSDALKTLGVE